VTITDPEVLQRLDAIEQRLEMFVSQQDLIMAQLRALGEQVGTLLQQATRKVEE
jgi:hypothetical protein